MGSRTGTPCINAGAISEYLLHPRVSFLTVSKHLLDRFCCYHSSLLWWNDSTILNEASRGLFSYFFSSTMHIHSPTDIPPADETMRHFCAPLQSHPYQLAVSGLILSSVLTRSCRAENYTYLVLYLYWRGTPAHLSSLFPKLSLFSLKLSLFSLEKFSLVSYP